VELFALLAGALIALVLAMLLSRGDRRRRDDDDADPPADPRRISRLCATLTGDPARDRPVHNQILALGPDVIPALLGELTELHRHTEAQAATHLARLEEVIADFGLAAVPPVTTALGRLHPTAAMVPGLVRVLRRLGPPGLRAVIHRGVATPDLAPFLPRFRDGLDDLPSPLADALLTVEPALRATALETCAGLLGERPADIERLWTRWDAAGRVALLGWLTDWPALADAALAARGLTDSEPTVRAAAARLATLLPTLPAAALAAALADPAPTVRAAAARALAARTEPSERAALRAALADPDPTVALEARLGLLGDGDAAEPDFQETDPQETDPPDPDTALADLTGPDPARRRLAIHHLARRRDDPRARERLIRLADDPDPAVRAEAVLALARAGDAIAADLLVRVLRALPPITDRLDAQETARRLGPALAVPLARRLGPDPPARIDALLAVLRTIPYADAVPPLLRGLEDARTGTLESQLTATLHLGGPPVHAAIDHALRHPARGLLAPALRFLAAYARPADLPLLFDLFDRHPPLRTAVLNLIEAQGDAAITPLRARIALGGEDTLMLALEHRLALLEAIAAP
jgi:HEAT repeat protein